MSNETPFFSILIPSYNRPDELRRSISSVISGSFKDYEIIISDDNSPKKDEIETVVKSFGSTGKVRFYQQASNLKEPDNKNFLVNEARGKFNIVLGDDDTLVKEALSYLYNYIVVEPKSDIYGFGYKIVDEHGRRLSDHRASKSVHLKSNSSRLKLLEAGLLPMKLFHPATFCCRAGVEKALPYSSQVGIGEDLFFLLEVVLNNYLITVVPKILFNWRKVQDIASVKQGNQSAEYLASFKSKLLMYERLLSYSEAPEWIAKSVRTLDYRFKFLYVELLRDTALINSTQHAMGVEMEKEFSSIKASFFWRLKVLLVRLARFLDLVSLVGLSQAFSILMGTFSNRKRSS
jgi:glycosyltransferase involved in cell wall biosynthesis